MNKPPKAFSSPPPVTPPGEPEAETQPVEATEEVMHHLDELSEHYKDNKPGTPEERAAALTEYNHALDKFENHEIRRLYDEGRVPTFDSMAKAAEIARAALAATGDEEALALAKLLTGRVQNVKGWARKYVLALIKFRRSKLAHARMNDEERRAALEQSDTDRRRIHNALLESLSVLTIAVEKGQEYAEYDAVREWNPGDPVAAETSNKPLIFSSKALTDRDLIRDWAIVADRIEEITKVLATEQ